ncbi:MAG TPA: phytoene/squalene synthase family protein [Gemmatimonadaceae bacterium]|jgi:phytoene synthase
MSEARESFARAGRSFAFASRLLPASDRERVARVYAYCRATDDLVDDHWTAASVGLHAQLDLWLDDSRRAHRGEITGAQVIDEAMAELRAGSVPFAYVEQLVAGVRMDIDARRYDDLAALSTYTVRVAGVVGLVMCGLFDVRERWLAERAVTLGCAMQLTNIVRDVGDDLDRGRLYLPLSLLRSYGVTELELDDMRRGRRPITPAYRAVIESLLTTADGQYRRALEAVPYLPGAFRRTVAVAAAVYRGIHDEVRRSGYDNLTRRAVTPLPRKCALGLVALRESRAKASMHLTIPSVDVA